MVDRKKASSSKGKQNLNQKTLYDMFSKKQPNKNTQPDSASQKSEQLVNAINDVDQVDQGVSEKPSLTLGPEVIVLEDTPSSPEILPVESDGFVSDSSGPIDTSSSVFNVDDDDHPEAEGVLEPTGSHHDDPIILSDSPVQLKAKPLTRAASSSTSVQSKYSISAPRFNESSSARVSFTPPPPSPSKLSRSFGAPLPDRFSQHVRGPQSKFAPSSLFPQSNHLRVRTYSFNTPLNSVIPPDSSPVPGCASAPTFRLEVEACSPHNAHLFDIPIEHQQSHPAIPHLIESSSSKIGESSFSSSNSHKLWTDKWHPTRADCVLGNEELALYLRDWLYALELQLQSTSGAQTSRSSGIIQRKGLTRKTGSKRQRVVRAVDKKTARKKRRLDSDEDDWIVYSDNSFEEMDEEAGSMNTNRRPRLYRRGSGGTRDFFSQDNGSQSTPTEKLKHPVRHTFNNHLTNTILLTGSHGVGKTAAVYACAEELDWDVFEVYPGIGRRNGANLESLVGEVGRNHLVQGKGGVGGKSSLRAMLLGKQRTDSTVPIPEDCQINEEEGSSVAVRQSCILLEEVDILYKEDANFWPTVVNIIKECRRPVILTCNDPTLVPLSDLPLQTRLDFQPCPPPIAVSYLQAICRAEGYMVKRESISQLQHDLTSVDGSERPDLRRIIHCLQLWCPMKDGNTTMALHDIACPDTKMEFQSGTVTSHEYQQDIQEVVAIGRHADVMSFTDCYLLGNRIDTPEKMTLQETKPCMDDIVGYTPLRGGSSWDESTYDRDNLIVSTVAAIGRSRGSFEVSARYGQELLQARVEYEKMLKEFGNNVAVTRSEIVRRPNFDMDYLPWIRQIVAADDAAEGSMEWAGGRKTRNSQRYERTIVLSEEERRFLEW